MVVLKFGKCLDNSFPIVWLVCFSFPLKGLLLYIFEAV